MEGEVIWPYVYRVLSVGRVFDGDTFWVTVDTGFRQSMEIPVRLYGFDTPEHRGPSDYEKQKAREAWQFTESFLQDGWVDKSLWVRTHKDPDNFGRWLGEVFVDRDGRLTYLGEELRVEGLASIWPTRWREEFYL